MLEKLLALIGPPQTVMFVTKFTTGKGVTVTVTPGLITIDGLAQVASDTNLQVTTSLLLYEESE